MSRRFSLLGEKGRRAGGHLTNQLLVSIAKCKPPIEEEFTFIRSRQALRRAGDSKGRREKGIRDSRLRLEASGTAVLLHATEECRGPRHFQSENDSTELRGPFNGTSLVKQVTKRRKKN